MKESIKQSVKFTVLTLYGFVIFVIVASFNEKILPLVTNSFLNNLLYICYLVTLTGVCYTIGKSMLLSPNKKNGGTK